VTRALLHTNYLLMRVQDTSEGLRPSGSDVNPCSRYSLCVTSSLGVAGRGSEATSTLGSFIDAVD
jgi:hypothetical protein